MGESQRGESPVSFWLTFFVISDSESVIMTNNTQKHGRGVLTPQQTDLLIDNIRKVQISTEGLSKKDVVTRSFESTFGGKEKWPIQPSSSTIARYWVKAFPSENPMNLGKRKQKRRSAQPLLDDLRRLPAPTAEPVMSHKKIVCICPECNTLIKIETTKL